MILKQIISWIETDINLWVDLNLFLFQKYFARNIHLYTTIAPTLTHVFIEKNLVFERDCANSSTELGVNLAAEREQVSLLKNVGVFQFYFVQMDRASGCFLTMSMKKLFAIGNLHNLGKFSWPAFTLVEKIGDLMEYVLKIFFYVDGRAHFMTIIMFRAYNSSTFHPRYNNILGVECISSFFFRLPIFHMRK